MKKIVSILLVLLLIAPSACAWSHESFDTYATVFGESELKDGTILNSGVVYDLNGVKITVSDSSVNVYGKGDAFISYCCAAIMSEDDDSTRAAENLGVFLLNLQLVKGGDSADPRFFTLVSGTSCAVAKNEEYGFRLMVKR